MNSVLKTATVAVNFLNTPVTTNILYNISYAIQRYVAFITTHGNSFDQILIGLEHVPSKRFGSGNVHISYSFYIKFREILSSRT